MQKVDVVLFSPPYFRFCGSHNNRQSPSLTYLSAYLERAGISHVIYNADATPSERYWSMKSMFQNFQGFIDAVDGRGSLYGEAIETLMGFEPRTVVVAGGEPLIATKDWGNPFIAAHYARMLRRLGVHTIGLGHFFTLDRDRFAGDFDCVLGGEPNEQIVDAVRDRRVGYLEPRPLGLDILPGIGRGFPAGQTSDFVMTSFGCRFPCAFCLVPRMYGAMSQQVRFVDIDTVVRDIQQRPETEIYLTDLTFTRAPKQRLRALAAALRAASVTKRYTIDTRADCITEEIADILVELGVRRVKLGVEGVTKAMIKSFNKRIELERTEATVRILRSRGIEIVTYLLIGGQIDAEDYERTRQYIKDLAPDFVPVAIWAYDLATDYRYDTQFSPVRLRSWGVEESVFFKYIDLQSEINPTVGKLLSLP
jgi:hypothetical protein